MSVRSLLFLSLLVVTGWANGDEDAESKIVIGPRNVYLYDGANALLARDGEKGVQLTLQGLERAAGARERKIGHANLCAGYLLLEQLETALQHCDWVLQRDPKHWRTYNNRALVYLRMGRYEESEADIAKGQELNPRSENLKEVKGQYLDEVAPVAEKIIIDDRRQRPDGRVEPEK